MECSFIYFDPWVNRFQADPRVCNNGRFARAPRYFLASPTGLREHGTDRGQKSEVRREAGRAELGGRNGEFDYDYEHEFVISTPLTSDLRSLSAVLVL